MTNTEEMYRFLWQLRDELRQLQRALDDLATRIDETYPF